MKLYQLKITEEELVKRLKNDDKTAFSTLYDSYSSALYGVIMKIVRTDPPAEDVLQEVFVKIWKKIETYDRQKGTIFTWMLNIARNTGIDKTRSEEFKKSSQTYDIDNQVSAIDKSRSQDYKIEHIGIQQLVTKLKPEHRQIIDLIYFNGYTQAEVSETLNIPLGTVKTRVKLAMNHLRENF